MTAWFGAEVLAAVLNGLCQGVVLTASVWLALRVVRLNASARHALWIGVLLAVVALPLANLGAGSEVGARATGAAAPPALVLPGSGTWVAWVFALWLLASGLLLARLAWSYAVLCRLKRSAGALPEAVADRCQLLGRKHGARGVRLLASAEAAVPMAAGLSKPVILLPASLASELSRDELDQVLVHELAHIRRWDDWTNLVARTFEALFFFHPAVWWIGGRLEMERELACDDCVVRNTSGARPYAACLLKLARGALSRARPRLASAAITGRREFTLRIEALLGGEAQPRRRWSTAAVAVAAALVVAGSTLKVAPFTVTAPLAPEPARAVLVAPPAELAQARRPASLATQASAPARPRLLARARTVQPAPPRLLAHAQPAQPPSGAPVQDASALSRGGEEFLYCVFYWNGESSGWIRILWVRVKPEGPRLHGA
ncbi:MAG: M56 family metallopeptidase [Bryobacteraceae bacterium]|jgi:beta-lactamase regulating signal transducer with metallopeptidase domain